MVKEIRIQISDQAIADLDGMRKALDLSTYADVIRRSLRLYRYVIEEVIVKDKELVVYNPRTSTYEKRISLYR